MPHKRYSKKLTHQEVIKLFDDGRYSVNLEQGRVYSSKTGKELFTYVGNDAGHLYVRLYCAPSYKAMPVSHVVWIMGTRSPVPKDFEVHHRNRNTKDNCFDNLFALHKIDHRKLHHGLIEQADAPF